MDAESICSGNPHVTSPPGLFPRHPPFVGMLRPSFISQRHTEEPPNIRDTSGISGNVFAHPQTSSSAPVSSRIEFHLEENYRRTNSHVYCREKWKTRARLRSEMPVRTVSQKFSHLQWRRLFKELWGRPTTTADFGSSFWQVPYASDICLLEDKIHDRGMYLFTISLRKRCSGSKKWSWLIQWMIWCLRHQPEEFKCRILKYSMRGLLQHWTTSCIIPISKGRRSVWRNKRPRKRTVSFSVDRLRTWFTITSGSLEPMILSKTTPICSLLLFRNDDIQEFDSKWDGILLSMTKIPHDDILEGLLQIKNTSPRNSRPYWNCTTWRLIKRS